MSFRWSRAKTESLINLVFQKPLLWDKTLGPKNPQELGEIWKSVADELGVSKQQAKGKWKALQSHFHKESAAQLKPRSGDAASTVNRQWTYYRQMSFLKENTYNQSTGNLDEELYDDDEDEQIEQPMQNSPPLRRCRQVTSESSSTSTTAAVPSKLEGKCVRNEELSFETEDPTKKSEWLFLLSILDHFNKITDNTLKMQARLEIFCLLFNFLTQNKKIRNQDVCEKDQSETTVANSHKTGVSAFENLKARDNEVSNGQDLKPKIGDIIHDQISYENEVEFIDISSIHEKKIKEVTIDVKPSETLKTWLLNPLVVKKEI